MEIALSLWRMVTDETRSRLDRVEAPVVLGTDGTELLLVDGVRWGEACDQANLHRLLLGWQDGARVVEANPRFAGYPAYDAQRVVREVSAVAVGADGVTEELAQPVSGGPPASFEDDRRVVEAVRARLLVQNGGHSPGVPSLLHEAVVPFFFSSEAFGDAFPGFVVARDTAPGDLADALVEGFFAHSDDADTDSYDRQLECYTADALDTARGLLLDSDAAVAARIVDALRDARWVLRTLGTGRIELQITQSPEGSTIRIVSATGKEVSATL
ncbi:hypothetical protein ROTAS13_04718 [Roseomonas sp. TAS13]|nr:hypothetical protein ROTAS13_04718 [Roseomonas sp. TAS13]